MDGSWSNEEQGRKATELRSLVDKSAPDFDKASGTRIAAIAGLIASFCAGLVCIVLGATIAKGSDLIVHVNPVAHELIPLAINIGVTLVTESLGYIHMVCLRWTLLHENRLDFNANLRLLTFSETNPANGVFANALFFLAIAICYTASGMILVPNTYRFYQTDGGTKWWEVSNFTSFSKATPMALGTAIITLCILSGWSLLTSNVITWSSNPFNTLSAAASKGAILHRDGRSMMSVHDQKGRSAPSRPQSVQKPSMSANTLVPRITFGTTAVLGVLIVWMTIVVIFGIHNENGKSWSIIPTVIMNNGVTGVSGSEIANQTITVWLQFFTAENPGIGPSIIHEPMMLGVLLFTVAVQSIITIGLHCAELQITLLRDEQVWRKMTSKGGSVRLEKYNSLFQPFTSWQNIVLLIFKPVIHWMFGSAMGVDYAAGILIRVPHVTYLTVLWALFLAFMLQISCSKPKGPLPASYGHLQTMADVIDDWAPRMYWGDKGEVRNSGGELRHAGTAGAPLPTVEMDALYI